MQQEDKSGSFMPDGQEVHPMAGPKEEEGMGEGHSGSSLPTCPGDPPTAAAGPAKKGIKVGTTSQLEAMLGNGPAHLLGSGRRHHDTHSVFWGRMTA